VSRKSKLASISCALALGLGATTSAQAAQPQIEMLSHPAEQFERSIETQKLEVRYRDLSRDAEDLGVGHESKLLQSAETTETELRDGIDELRKRVTAAKSEPEFGPVAGVSQATLDAIAACESGGDPTAVDASGTYFGKYQFDTGTWASVGGSGSPADASEAEQDYRASLLYSRAGSSPWPVCGV
jgi:soluble lytic murein transglycosylase-like protein